MLCLYSITMKFIILGLLIICLWYFFFYKPPTEIDNIITSLNNDFQSIQEGFISSAAIPDTDDIKTFYNRATDLSNNLAMAEKKIEEMNEHMNQKQFEIAAGEASKILEANRNRVDIANLSETVQQSYIANTNALNKLMDEYKTYVGNNIEKLKELAEKSIRVYLVNNNYVNGIQPVRDGLGEIHNKIRLFLEKNGIIIDPLPKELLSKKNK